jgi:hypothetical protein
MYSSLVSRYKLSLDEDPVSGSVWHISTMIMDTAISALPNWYLGGLNAQPELGIYGNAIHLNMKEECANLQPLSPLGADSLRTNKSMSSTFTVPQTAPSSKSLSDPNSSSLWPTRRSPQSRGTRAQRPTRPHRGRPPHRPSSHARAQCHLRT